MKKLFYILPIILLAAGCNLFGSNGTKPSDQVANRSQTAQSGSLQQQGESWKTFSRADFQLSFNYPADWNVVVSSDEPDFLILLLYQGQAKTTGQEDLRLDVYKNSKQEEENIDQDAGGLKYNAQLTLGSTIWKVFNEPLQPKANELALYYLRHWQDSNLYVVNGRPGQTSLDLIQTQIISSFQF